MLSTTQKQVLNLASQGLKNKQIAVRLNISETTVRQRLCEARKLTGGFRRPCTLDELDMIAERIWQKYQDPHYYDHEISSKPQAISGFTHDRVNGIVR